LAINLGDIMKKVIYFIIVFLLVFLSSCDPVSYSFDVKKLQDNVLKIELVMFENDNPTIVTVDEDTKLSVDLSLMTVVAVLDVSQNNDFIADMNGITFHETKNSVNSPLGYTVLVYIENEEMLILSRCVRNKKGYTMCAKFKTNGDYIEHVAELVDGRAFDELIKKYFGVSSRDF
jgi:hypothetical protein